MERTESERVAILAAACERAITTLTVPAAEYVPAIPDAWRVLTDALTEVGMADFSSGPWTLKKRKAFMELPMEERRLYLEAQSEKSLLEVAYLPLWEN